MKGGQFKVGQVRQGVVAGKVGNRGGGLMNKEASKAELASQTEKTRLANRPRKEGETRQAQKAS